MRVAKLIERLQRMPQDSEAYIGHEDGLGAVIEVRDDDVWIDGNKIVVIESDLVSALP